MGDGMVGLSIGVAGITLVGAVGGIIGLVVGLATAMVRLAVRRREVKDVATFVATRALVGVLIGAGTAVAALFLSPLWR